MYIVDIHVKCLEINSRRMNGFENIRKAPFWEIKIEKLANWRTSRDIISGHDYTQAHPANSMKSNIFLKDNVCWWQDSLNSPSILIGYFYCKLQLTANTCNNRLICENHLLLKVKLPIYLVPNNNMKNSQKRILHVQKCKLLDKSKLVE